MVINGQFTKVRIRKSKSGYRSKWAVLSPNGYDTAVFRTWELAIAYATSLPERRVGHRYSTAINVRVVPIENED